VILYRVIAQLSWDKFKDVIFGLEKGVLYWLASAMTADQYYSDSSISVELNKAVFGKVPGFTVLESHGEAPTAWK
jgi:hypothetical protein